MQLFALWFWHHRKPFNSTIFLISILSLCIEMNVTSWTHQNIYAHGAVLSRRSSSPLRCSSTDINQSDKDDGNSLKRSDSAKFTLTGSICGQKHEYLLENLSCRNDSEIQFCGKYINCWVYWKTLIFCFCIIDLLVSRLLFSTGPTSHQAVLKWTSPPKRW